MPGDFVWVMADDQIGDIHAYLVSLPPAADDRSAGWFPTKLLSVAAGESRIAAEMWRPKPVPATAPRAR